MGKEALPLKQEEGRVKVGGGVSIRGTGSAGTCRLPSEAGLSWLHFDLPLPSTGLLLLVVKPGGLGRMLIFVMVIILFPKEVCSPFSLPHPVARAVSCVAARQSSGSRRRV